MRKKEHPELDRLLKWSKEYVNNMTPEELEEMLSEQRKSWARQDMD